jgi:mannose-6-phosphate isomerase-like protein (cupin superfamily)
MKNIAIILSGPKNHEEDFDSILLDGRPSARYLVNACKHSSQIDSVFLLSNNDIIKNIASITGATFVSSDLSFPENDKHDTLNILSNIVAEVEESNTVGEIANVLIINSLSPLLSQETIKQFCYKVDDLQTNTVIVSGVERGSCFRRYDELIDPVCVMAGFKYSTIKSKDIRNNLSYKDFDNFLLPRLERAYLATHEDMYLIEPLLFYRKKKESVGQFRFEDNIIGIDEDLDKLIKDDGSPLPEKYHFEDVVKKITLDQAQVEMGGGSWSYPVVYNDTDQVCFIQQQPGEGCRNHYHATKAEFWVVFQGAFEWRLGDGSIVEAKEGEIVYLPKGTVHTIICTSLNPGVRLACGARDMEHIYV